MDHEQHAPGLTDAAIACEIERALQVEPGPAFLASVRARVAEKPPAAQWKLYWMAVPASAVVVIVGVALAFTWLRSTSDGELIPVHTMATSAAAAVTSGHMTPAEPRAVHQDITRVPSRPARPERTASPRVDIVISPGEAAALKRLLNRGTSQPLNMIAEEDVVSGRIQKTSGSDEIVIPPIVIDPLENHRPTEGVRP